MTQDSGCHEALISTQDSRSITRGTAGAHPREDGSSASVPDCAARSCPIQCCFSRKDAALRMSCPWDLATNAPALAALRRKTSDLPDPSRRPARLCSGSACVGGVSRPFLRAVSETHVPREPRAHSHVPDASPAAVGQLSPADVYLSFDAPPVLTITFSLEMSSITTSDSRSVTLALGTSDLLLK